MASADDVRKLAALSRLSVSDAELEKFSKEFEGILSYVGQIDELSVAGAGPERPPLRNIMREDGEPHETGRYTKQLVEQFPEKDDNALSVKQIISHE